jgi:hypothetical protein
LLVIFICSYFIRPPGRIDFLQILLHYLSQQPLKNRIIQETESMPNDEAVPVEQLNPEDQDVVRHLIAFLDGGATLIQDTRKSLDLMVIAANNLIDKGRPVEEVQKFLEDVNRLFQAVLNKTGLPEDVESLVYLWKEALKKVKIGMKMKNVMEIPPADRPSRTVWIAERHRYTNSFTPCGGQIAARLGAE